MIKERQMHLASFKTKKDAEYVEVCVQQSTDPYMDEFFEEVEDIRQNIQQIQTKVEEMKKIHSRVLCLPQTERMKQRLEDIMTDIKRISIKVSERLKVMEQNINQSEETSLLGTEMRIRKSQSSNLWRKLIQVMTDYFKTQTDYREWCKNTIKKDLEKTNRSLTDGKLEEMLSKGNLALLTLGIITDEVTDNDTEVTKQTLNTINERFSDIINLENSIRELHDMFKDMTFIIENQGEMIDTTGIRVQKTEKYTETAKQDISKAVDIKQKSRAKKILILGLLCVVVFVLACVVVLAIVGF